MFEYIHSSEDDRDKFAVQETGCVWIDSEYFDGTDLFNAEQFMWSCGEGLCLFDAVCPPWGSYEDVRCTGPFPASTNGFSPNPEDMLVSDARCPGVKPQECEPMAFEWRCADNWYDVKTAESCAAAYDTTVDTSERKVECFVAASVDKEVPQTYCPCPAPDDYSVQEEEEEEEALNIFPFLSGNGASDLPDKCVAAGEVLKELATRKCRLEQFMRIDEQPVAPTNSIFSSDEECYLEADDSTVDVDGAVHPSEAMLCDECTGEFREALKDFAAKGCFGFLWAEYVKAMVGDGAIDESMHDFILVLLGMVSSSCLALSSLPIFQMFDPFFRFRSTLNLPPSHRLLIPFLSRSSCLNSRPCLTDARRAALRIPSAPTW